MGRGLSELGQGPGEQRKGDRGQTLLSEAKPVP